MKKNKTFSVKSSGVATALISFSLALNMALLANRKSSLSFFSDSQNPDVFYLIFAALMATLLGFFFKQHGRKFKSFGKKVLMMLFPFEIVLLLSLFLLKPDLSVLFFLFAQIYIFIALFLIIKKFSHHGALPVAANKKFSDWLRTQGRMNLALALLAMIVFLSFGTFHITKFSAVDEPLWTFDRIPSFWKNVSQMNWNKTNISDKPGISVALISGVGLLNVDPKQYDPDIAGSEKLDTKKMNFALRFPLLLFATFSLALFYFLIERLLGARTATLSIVLIGTSPILVGMSRIINPDALLWIFAPLSLLSFLVYQKRRRSFYLHLTAFLLGFSILTKYVANILYVFFFLMLIAEYVFNQIRYQEISLRQYILCSLRDYALMITISLATFFLFYPGTWMRPDRLFEGTILSQAFVSTWPIFALIFIFVLIDTFLFKNTFIKKFLAILVQKRRFLATSCGALFLTITAFVFANVWGDMKFYDFQQILASPKTSYKENGFLGFFISNFYPLLFAVSPLALFAFVFMLIRTSWQYEKIKNKAGLNVVIFLALFIFAYYLGTTVNNVAAISRYQIMLYPLLLIISAIGFSEMYKIMEKKYALEKFWFHFLTFLILAISTCSLYSSKPFYLSYASWLLPNENYIDLKDMGPGSYEVAQYLNSLPDAEKLTIWTDKTGVCTFFKGSCYGDLSYAELEGVSLDYVAVSWGRKSRTTNMVRSQGRLATHEVFNFAKYYDQQENIVFEILVGNRPSQYIKLIKVR
ncbi:MAG: hypothetical protein ACD_56C00136G0003 [uncultured bacterium]|nr:MAG: hypothetical protein ACD_56C00136G0003 [uncultured bacterium]